MSVLEEFNYAYNCVNIIHNTVTVYD